jgi:hypothetical protein
MPALSRPLSFGPGQVLVLLGVVAVVASMFLHWLDLTVSGFGISHTTTVNASSVPAAFLFNHETRSKDPSLLVVLIPIAVLALADVFLFRHRVVTFLAGIASIVVAGLYAYQLDKLTGPVNDASRNVLSLDVFDLIGVGAYVCLGGGIAMLVGALLTRPKPPTPFALDAPPPGPMTAAPPTWGAPPPPTWGAPPPAPSPPSPTPPPTWGAPPPEQPQADAPGDAPGEAPGDAPPESTNPS